MKISNEAYDVLAILGRVILPALATMITTMGADLGLGKSELVAKLIMAFVVFLNTILEGMSKSYYKEKTVEVVEAEYIPEELEVKEK